MMSIAKLLFATACQPLAAKTYRPGDGVPVEPILHPADGRPGIPSGCHQARLCSLTEPEPSGRSNCAAGRVRFAA